MLTNVKVLLEGTGLKVAENCFLRPPVLPYIVFLDDSSYSGSDNKIYICERDITVELYSEKINREKEKAIEEILSSRSIGYSKNRTWIDSEKFFKTVYDFKLYEKIGGIYNG